MKIVVLDIGGTTIKSGEFLDGKLINLKESDTEAKKGGQHVVERAIQIISTYEGFQRIGISTAGQVNSDKGSIIYANENIPGYTGIEIKKIVEEKFGVPVSVENDVNAAALGEATFGAGRDHKDFLCLTYGTGVGGAIVMDKKIYKGSSYSAGEFGALITHASERNAKEDMFSGCYEKYASTTALVKKCMLYDKELTTGRKIFDKLQDPEVRKRLDEWIQEIVYGLVSIIHLFNPSCIVLGGGIMAQKYIIEHIQHNLYEQMMSSYTHVTIKQAALGNTAGLLGAVQSVLQLTNR